MVVSAASIWEAGNKAALGKLEIPGSLSTAIADEGFEPLGISLAHAEVAGQLLLDHRDPFDRMLIAQAQVENLAVVTRDRVFDRYDVTVVPC